MQSSNIDPGDWPSLSERLSPPEGWSARMRTLDGDLTVDLDGHVRVVMDELHNVYNLLDV